MMSSGDWLPEELARKRKAARVARAVGESILVFAVLFFIFSLVGVGAASGEEARLFPTLPTSRVYPAPGGILFPGFNVAAGTNAAALPTEGKGTALQAAVTPPLQSGDPTGVFGGIAASNGKGGIGAGYLGSKPPGASMTHGLFVGGGYSFRPVSLGVQLRDTDLRNGVNPSVDAGLVVGEGKGFEFGGVLYDLNHATRAAVGIGYGEKKYNLEANVLLPAFSNFNNDYVLTAATNVSAGIFGLYFRASYYTLPTNWDFTFGGQAWVTNKLALLAQFTTDRTLTAGLTVLL